MDALNYTAIFCRYLFGFYFFAFAGTAFSQLPPLLLVPWRFININSEIISGKKAAFEHAWHNFARKHGIEGKVVDFFNNNQELLNNNARKSIKLMAFMEGVNYSKSPLRPGISGPVSVEPVFCSLGSRWMVFTIATEVGSQLLFGVGNYLLSYDDQISSYNDRSFLGEVLTRALDSSWEKSVSSSNGGDKVFRILIKSGKKIDRLDQTSDMCLQVLLMSHLKSSGFAVLQTIGLENLEYFRRLNLLKKTPVRANRHLIWSGHFLNSKKILDGGFPVPFKMFVRYTEAVFAREIRNWGSFSSSLDLGSENNLELFWDPKVINVIKEEEKFLAYNKPPEVSHIYGSWVYLDRGRSWGLNIGSRLRSESGEIKGQVIGFFGPGLSIKNAEGSVISEGAIAFIRKGQKKVKKRLKLYIDLQAYPTEWPPKKDN